MQTVRPVKVIGMTMIESVPFLIIDVDGPQKALGYLELDRVGTILPTQGVFSIEPRKRDATLIAPGSSSMSLRHPASWT